MLFRSTAKNPDATQAEREKAAKVFTDMEGTELYEKMMEGSSEIGIRIKAVSYTHLLSCRMMSPITTRDVDSIRIHPITGWHSLFPLSHTCTPFGTRAQAKKRSTEREHNVENWKEEK